MSFSSDTKAELCGSRLDRRTLAVAECYGVLLYCNTFRASEIRIITASAPFAELLPRLFKKAFSVSFDLLPPEDARGKRSFCIHEPEKIARILASFGGDAAGPISHHVNLGVLEEPGFCQGCLSRRRQRHRSGKAFSSRTRHQSSQRQPGTPLHAPGDGS